MTIISTHRVHTYKATSCVRPRDISPKKVPRAFTHYKKKNAPTIDTILANLIRENYIKTAPVPMVNTAATVWGNEYNVTIPQGIDIYEGLRLWYPNLYKEMLCENEWICSEDTMNEEEMEAAWAKYEYQEWLFD